MESKPGASLTPISEHDKPGINALFSRAFTKLETFKEILSFYLGNRNNMLKGLGGN